MKFCYLHFPGVALLMKSFLRDTAQNVSVFGDILACIFPHSDLIQTRITPNMGNFHTVKTVRVMK